MKQKKIIGIIITILVLILIGGSIYYVLTKQDKNTTLTILEKQWIEENKNNVIDLSVVNEVPIFNYDGEGIIFEFINSIEKDTGLTFNKISYTNGSSSPTAYSFMYTDKLSKNDILVYEDEYALMTKENVKYAELNKIPNMLVGVLEKDLGQVNFNLKANSNLSYKTYKTVEELTAEIKKDNSELKGIVLPKTTYLKEASGEKPLYISYNISELNEKLVLRLGDSKKLNTIIKKYYKKWYKEAYQKLYNEHLTNAYFTFNEIYEEQIVKFRSKRYQYAFINNAPYDALVDRHLIGINNEIIKNFAKVSNIEINFKEYNSLKKLVEEFNQNKIDFYLNTSAIDKYKMDIANTVSIYNEEVVVISHQENNIDVNSLASLKEKTVKLVADTTISQSLNGYGVKVKAYNNVKDLINHISKKDIIIIDKNTYEIYNKTILKDYNIDYTYNLDKTYNYIVRDIKDNKIFAQYYNFYLSFINEKEYINAVNYKMFEEKIQNNPLLYIVVGIVIIAAILSIVYLKKKENKNNNKKIVTVSKENKLKYIDILTSLKNRNYLNDNIQKWDDSEIYPQAIVIVDLNNVAYINDNYGHEEGDNVIREAANVLIKNQIENSEMMRTNGNEFLIYMVEHEEKQVVTYIRKLNKEFKEIAHGFGAAIGYSMIYDAIKTVDDAINEATLDMRNNKEEANN